MTIGLCTTIGFSALLATGAGTAPAAASAVSADSVSADSVSASSTGSKVVSFGKKYLGYALPVRCLYFNYTLF